MNLRMFRWERALEVATQYRQHVDTVLLYRKQYLKKYGKSEDNAMYLRYAGEVNVDPVAVDEAKKRARREEGGQNGEREEKFQ